VEQPAREHDGAAGRRAIDARAEFRKRRRGLDPVMKFAWKRKKETEWTLEGTSIPFPNCALDGTASVTGPTQLPLGEPIVSGAGPQKHTQMSTIV